MKEKTIKTFKEFYPFYLAEHDNKICRLLHVIGTSIVIALLLTSIIEMNPYWLIFVPITGYGFAWLGHYVFQKNVPATFTYPWWSLKSDFKLYYDVITGKLKLNASTDKKVY